MEEIDLIVASLLEEFKIQHAAIHSGNHRANNKSVDRAHKLFKELRTLKKVEKLLPSLNSTSEEIQASAAVYCLPIAEDQCISVLRKIRDNNTGILSIQAKYAIQNWENKQYFLWDD